MRSLQDLFVHELRDIYSAETQLTKALPKMAKTASTDELRSAFELHLEETQNHVTRLDEVFQMLGVSPRGPKCKGMEGLIEEGNDLMKEKSEPMVSDAGLITSAQRVEHYEIAAYGGVRTFAQMLGLTDAAQLLQQTLDEEKRADEKLTTIAEGWVNQSAMQMSDRTEYNERDSSMRGSNVARG